MLSTQQSARPPLSMLSSSEMGLGMSVDTAYAFLKTTKTVSYTSARVSKRVCHGIYCPTRIMSGGQNMAAIFGPGQNMADTFCPGWLLDLVLPCNIWSGPGN